MNVKQLREVLAKAPDDAEIVCSGVDHSYYRARASLVTAESDGKRDGYLGEYYDDDNLGTGCKKVKVLFVG